MRAIKRIVCMTLIGLLLPCMFSRYEQAAGQQQSKVAAYTSFRAIPDVTDNEIRAVEALQKENATFVYGMMPSTEAFIEDNGAIGGYAALVCGWLTELFKIPFKPALYEWNDLLAGLENRTIDFTGELGATNTRRQTYYMTDAITERTVKYIRTVGSAPFADIAASRPLRFAFLGGAVTADAVASRTQYRFETIIIDSFDTAYTMLKNGQADAFFAEGGTRTATLDAYSDVVVEDFFPLIYSPVSLSTQNPSLEPIITIVQKALQHGAASHLAELYTLGRQAYMKHKLSLHLNEAEKAYIRNHRVVRFAAEHYNYPTSFYNTYERKWQGIAFDVIKEVEKLTGLRFERVNDQHAEWPVLLKTLESGEASMLTELLHSEDRAGRFVWPQTILLSDNYALLSKSDFRNISMGEVRNVKVGLTKATVYSELFRNWFPNHEHIVEYESSDAAFTAVDRGEVDMVMSSQRRLLALTSYHELSSYKANIVFDFASQSTFGFNKNEAVLCSIIDKALKMIDVRGIATHWVHTTYDYQGKLARDQRQWLIGVSALLMSVLILLCILFQKKRHEGKVLEELVGKRTLELEMRTATLEAVINNYKGVIWSVNDNGVITTFNGQYVKVIGVEPSFLEGKKLEIARMKNRHIDIIENVAKTFCEGPQDWIGEIDGSVFHSYTVPMRDGKGHIIGVVGSTDDVTATIKLQRDLETAVEAAKTANLSKSAFLASMSHEIRTPMNAILGVTQLQLLDETLAPGIREAFGTIYNSSDMLLGIINDILDMSKIEAGKLALMPAAYEVASLINDTVQLNIMRIGSKPVEFELGVDEDTPAVVLGDALRVKQILNNVLSNAFKYTEQGVVTLSVSHETGNAEKESEVMLVFVVSDTGHGMTAEQVSQLFDEYSRFNQETNRTIEGTGLGMSITRNLVRMMNGEIAVESEPGMGSTFIVRLPQGKTGSAVLGREVVDKLRQFRINDTAQMKRTQIIREPMPYGSVLVVDDMATNRHVAKGLLAYYHLKVDAAESGLAAIEKIKLGTVYDIVFMDHMMPGMDGIEATKVIRSLGYTNPVVALTANAMVGRAEMFRANGFDDFLAKPIDLRQMNVVLNKFVRDRQPPEVVEAARRQKNVVNADASDVTPPASADPNLAKIFIQDAVKAISMLETICVKQGGYSDEDIRIYIVSVHGMKSALANIGELNLSVVASNLAQAGRERNTAVISSNTLPFLNALREVVEKLRSKEDDEGSETTDADQAYLREKLLAVKAACVAYNKKAAKDALTEIRQKAWPHSTKDLLDTIAEHLLHSKFKGIISIVDTMIMTL